MGHSYIEKLPQTQEWRDVVARIRGGAPPDEVAGAVLAAVQDVIRPFARDPGVVQATWYLIRLPLAARDDDAPAAFRRLGLGTGDEPGLMDVLAGVSDALDREVRPGDRTDLGEIAQTALAADARAHGPGPGPRPVGRPGRPPSA